MIFCRLPTMTIGSRLCELLVFMCSQIPQLGMEEGHSSQHKKSVGFQSLEAGGVVSRFFHPWRSERSRLPGTLEACLQLVSNLSATCLPLVSPTASNEYDSCERSSQDRLTAMEKAMKNGCLFFHVLGVVVCLFFFFGKILSFFFEYCIFFLAICFRFQNL